MVRILPQQFYEDKVFKKVMVDGLSCVIYKRLDATVLGKEGFISTHAITMVLRGLLRIENDDGLFIEVPPGRMVFMPKGLYTVSDILTDDGDFEAMMFFFEPDVIQQFLDSIRHEESTEKSVSHMLIRTSEEIKVFVETLLRMYLDKPQANRHLTKMKLFELLLLINEAFDEHSGFATNVSTLNNKERKSLREFMQSNFHKPLCIEDYAYLTGRSISTFTRDFKSKFNGISPKKWLIEQRLEKARSILSANHINHISEAAWESGYENIPHFIKEFHRRYGITPKQFLIKHRMTAIV